MERSTPLPPRGPIAPGRSGKTSPPRARVGQVVVRTPTCARQGPAVTGHAVHEPLPHHCARLHRSPVPRVSQKRHPGFSRVYTRVLTEGGCARRRHPYRQRAGGRPVLAPHERASWAGRHRRAGAPAPIPPGRSAARHRLAPRRGVAPRRPVGRRAVRDLAKPSAGASGHRRRRSHPRDVRHRPQGVGAPGRPHHPHPDRPPQRHRLFRGRHRQKAAGSAASRARRST